MLLLREYQKRSLDALQAYLSLVAQDGAKRAFVIQTERPYRSVPQLPELPYVCLRVPTGGGKTLMACHALGMAAKTYLQREKTVCLWLVPSNAIREQTLAALRNREHPYRQVIDEQFEGLVRVMDITEALYIQRNALEDETVIIISTLAALRVEDTEGRKVYEDSGALQHHFSGLSRKLKDLIEKREDGTIPHSLSNVLKLWRPVVFMDEAHNARTPLSFHTLARFNPSCIIEFTATPETSHNPERDLFASNVLHHVSAAELKVEKMIKLPIKLRTHEDWQEVIAEALQMQQSLEKAAESEEKISGEYIRPIILFQAQPKNQDKSTLTVEVVKKTLIEDFKISEEAIAIATGQTHGIDNVDIFARACPIRYIITVYALKEGWDCSYAYILCSLAEMGSSRAVEQILGRILRLPGAKRKTQDPLNWAYAFVASPKFLEAANSLKDALLENGFQKMEAIDFIKPFEQVPISIRGPLFEQVSCSPDFSKLPPILQKTVTYEQSTGRLVLGGDLSFREKQALIKSYDLPEDKAAVERLYQAVQGARVETDPPLTTKDPFQVPLMAVRFGDQVELFEESHFLDVPWNLAELNPSLSEEEFPSKKVSGATGQVDVDDEGMIAVQFVHQIQEQISWLTGEAGWTMAALANWIDRKIYHPDIPQAYSSLFIHKSIENLIEKRGLIIEQLAREKFRLRNALATKIQSYRLTQHVKAYQQALFSDEALTIQVGPELILPLSEEAYSPNSYYDGSFKFQKHYFKHIGELRSEGEEFECAVFLDGLSQIEFWVRNLERRKDTSFWLQTASDRFYPDFLALLEDGRILAVEFKGEHLWSNDDSKEKRAVGELWAQRSGGKCLFVMTKGKSWSMITKGTFIKDG